MKRINPEGIAGIIDKIRPIIPPYNPPNDAKKNIAIVQMQ